MSSKLKNMSIAAVAPLPSIIFYLSFLHHHNNPSTNSSKIWQWCYNRPLLLANLLFFLNVDVAFWLIGLAMSNNWLIDLYWTVIPLMMVHYYWSHPLGNANPVRSAVAIALTWAWSARLTHNYFRRERWEWGAREDWRFSDMREQYGERWWWVSFFAVYVSQQVNCSMNCLTELWC